MQVTVDNLIATQDVGKRSGHTANLLQHFARGVRSLALPCSRAGTEVVQMLAGVTATFAAGTSTLVLGAPGSGKSTLLRAVAGRLHSRDPAVGAAVRFSGATLSELKSQRGVDIRRLAAYAPQVRRRHRSSALQPLWGACFASAGCSLRGDCPLIPPRTSSVIRQPAARRAPDVPYRQGGADLRPRVLRRASASGRK